MDVWETFEQLETRLCIAGHGGELKFLLVTVHIVHQSPCRRISHWSPPVVQL